MDTRRIVLSAVFVSLVLGLGEPAIAEGESVSRYEELMKSKAYTDSIRTLGLTILALPYEREDLEPQIAQYAWYNQADAGLDEADRELAASDMRCQLDAVSRVVEKYGIGIVKLIGITHVGNINNIDLYYAADTPHGPVIFRVSVYFDPADPPRLFSLAVFEGWKECRDVMPSVQHRAGDKIFGVTYDGEEEPIEAEPPAADEA